MSAQASVAAPMLTTYPVPVKRHTVDVVSSLCILVGIGLMVLPVAVIERLPRSLVIGATFLVLLMLAAHAYVGCRRRALNPWISPVFVVTAYYFYRYGWGSIVTNSWHELNWVAFPELRYWFHRFGTWERLPIACHLILLFAFGMYLGLRRGMTVRPAVLPALRWNIDELKLKRSILWYTPVAIGVVSVLQFQLPLSMKFAVALLGDFVYPAIVLVSYWAWSGPSAAQRLKWKIALAILCLGSMPVGLQTGQMVGVLRPFAMAVVGYVVARGRLPVRTVLLGLPLLVLFVVPFTRIYKGHGYAGMPVVQRLYESYVKYDRIGWDARMELSMERLLLRWAGPGMPAVYSRYYPAIHPFEYGRTFGMELRSLVPRIIWPDKGYGTYELNHYSARVGLVQLDGNTTALFDALSEYYLNFGMLGMFVLSIVHGYYFAILHNWLVQSGLIGVAVFTTLLALNEDFYGVGMMFIAHVKVIPVWMTMFYFFSRHRRERLRG